MKGRTILPTVIVATLAAGAGSAAPAKTCMDTASAQAELTACAVGMAAKADARLNAAYQDILRYVDGDQRTALVKAQRAWIAYRDADCAFVGFGGGSIAPMNEALCRAGLSDDRAKELNLWPPNAPRSALAPVR
jgi:uncharacterized protein YecT (DUF1311 family)